MADDNRREAIKRPACVDHEGDLLGEPQADAPVQELRPIGFTPDGLNQQCAVLLGCKISDLAKRGEGDLSSACGARGCALGSAFSGPGCGCAPRNAWGAWGACRNGGGCKSEAGRKPGGKQDAGMFHCPDMRLDGPGRQSNTCERESAREVMVPGGFQPRTRPSLRMSDDSGLARGLAAPERRATAPHLRVQPDTATRTQAPRAPGAPASRPSCVRVISWLYVQAWPSQRPFSAQLSPWRRALPWPAPSLRPVWPSARPGPQLPRPLQARPARP